jgi:hypothetical protein
VRAVLALACAAALAGCGQDVANSYGNSVSTDRDITISKCRLDKDDLGSASKASIAINNRSDHTQLYLVLIGVYSPDGAQVGEIHVRTEPLFIGEIYHSDVRGTAPVGATEGPAHCVIQRVEHDVNSDIFAPPPA